MFFRRLLCSLLLFYVFGVSWAGPTSDCVSETRVSWTPLEGKVWGFLCESKIAVVSRTLDASSKNIWTEEQRLSAEFLEEIVRDSRLQAALPASGVRIFGGKVKGRLNLESLSLTKPYDLHGFHFEAGIDLSHASSTSNISFDESLFSKGIAAFQADLHNITLNSIDSPTVDLSHAAVRHVIAVSSKIRELRMNSTHVHNLVLREAVIGTGNLIGLIVDQRVDLGSASVEERLDLGTAQIGGVFNASEGANIKVLDARNSTFGSQVWLNDAQFTEILLSRSTIRGSLEVISSVIEGKLSLDEAVVDQSVDLSRSKISEADLKNTDIGNVLSVQESTLSGTFDFQSVNVGKSAYFRRTTVRDRFLGVFAKIGGHLDLRGARFSTDVNLSGMSIADYLYLSDGEQKVAWDKGVFLDLSGASARTIGDSADTWPSTFDISGMQFSHVAGQRIQERTSDWATTWLSGQKPYHGQPYRQLANILESMDESQQAEDVRFESKERQRERHFEQGRFLRWIGLSILKFTIGYGIGQGYFRASAIFLGLWILGVAMLFFAWKKPIWCGYISSVWISWAVYSFGKLLPIIDIDRRNQDVVLKGGALYYFYFHSIAGFLLASILIAGFAGLTQS